ncbi:endonuclease/exonuclease/phosphatase family protein [Parendozoicomonas haliclonae]|uniref:Endonuclease/Exonuclease/phosphatase family protein n=1 Tax=Parendozoicomonas haliclonae TaxID=1960125 RepID=A0A1X7AJ62_9GAMM|nr:endonuclease/exonuclease/phosphatase family protein [Parendozoicomonas haliclonae]SMA46216.1 Endonuclease/Exonuclease/phosphatase family protein [Parendozoicomonas haliclonae]
MPLKSVQKTLQRRIRQRALNQSGSFKADQVEASDPDWSQESRRLETLRLLSFNIQVGITTQQYGHYLTRSWQHVLPSSSRQKNLDRIARLLRSYDVVALQEADGGSLRSSFINQIEYLAHRSGFPWWYQQLNRNLGQFAQHSNGLLTRCHPELLEDHKLPGLIPGRGAIVAELGETNPLLIVIMHLALSRRGREHQLGYIRRLIDAHEHVVLMGDMNTHAEQLLYDSPLNGAGLHNASMDVCTFPSWKPKKSLDHILLSSSLKAVSCEVLDFPQSDHLPVAVEIQLPEGLQLMSRNAPTAH